MRPCFSSAHHRPTFVRVPLFRPTNPRLIFPKGPGQGSLFLQLAHGPSSGRLQELNRITNFVPCRMRQPRVFHNLVDSVGAGKLWATVLYNRCFCATIVRLQPSRRSIVLFTAASRATEPRSSIRPRSPPVGAAEPRDPRSDYLLVSRLCAASRAPSDQEIQRPFGSRLS